MDGPANELQLTDHQTQRDLFGVILWTPEELAPLYGVSAETLKGWLREHRIQGIHLGRKWYVPDAVIRQTIVRAMESAGFTALMPRRRASRPPAVKATNDQTPALFDTNNA